MEEDTPEYFYQQIQLIQTALNKDPSDDNYTTYYTQLKTLRQRIQGQMDQLLHEKPVKSQQMFAYYREIYNTSYMTNFCFVLGIGLILWFLVKSTFNTASSSPVETPNDSSSSFFSDNVSPPVENISASASAPPPSLSAPPEV